MDEHTKNQTGSPARDLWKRKHKDLSNSLWACDVDFVLIEKLPYPDIVAVLDYKSSSDDVTFTEVIAYNAFTKRGIRVFIVQGDAESGAFTISQYAGGHHGKPTYKLNEVCTTADWSQYEQWEKTLRENYKQRYSPQ